MSSAGWPDLLEAWISVNADWTLAADAVAFLTPAPMVTRYACIPVGRWAAVLNNSPLGTDVGVLPSLAARELRSTAIRVCVADRAPYPARILEVYGPHGDPPLAIIRSIAAANDGGRWVFETHGKPFAFEDLSAYSRRLKARRLTAEMVIDYLRGLDVPIDQEPEWTAARLVVLRDSSASGRCVL